MAAVDLMAQVLSANDPQHVEQAAAALRRGGIVAFPTETVYGLGADAFNVKAVARIFEVKKRPSFDPLIVHVMGAAQASALWTKTPPEAMALIERFWPGPLTLVLPKTDLVPDLVTAGLRTVAVRMPKHETALELIKRLGHPIAAPSANLFGYTSATSAQAVNEDLGSKIDIILDGGSSSIGVESTVIKIENGRGILLRPGGVPVEEIEKLLPVIPRGQTEEGVAAESPGLLKSHYAPWTPFVMMGKPFGELIGELEEYHRQAQAKEIAWPRLGLLTFSNKYETSLFEAVETLSPKRDLYQAAANLFGAIRKLDKVHLDLIIAEETPRSGLGLAIMDRLTKAASGKSGADSFFLNLIQ